MCAFPLFSLIRQKGWKTWMFVKRDFMIDLSYRFSFALEALHIVIAIAAFFFWATLLESKHLEGYESFPFMLVGLTVNAYMSTCMVCFAQAIRGAQITGTLKAVLATSTSPTEFLALSSAYPFVRATLAVLAYGVVGFGFGVSFARIDIPAAAAIFVTSMLAFVSIGLLSASFTLLFKRGDPLLWIFGSASWLLGGVIYPTSVLPSALRQLAELLPITHALRGGRAALLAHGSIANVLPEVSALVVFAGLLMPVGLAAFWLGLRRVKVVGTLGHQ